MKRLGIRLMVFILCMMTLLAGCSTSKNESTGSKEPAQQSVSPSASASASASASESPKLEGDLISENPITIKTYFANNSSFIDYSPNPDEPEPIGFL